MMFSLIQSDLKSWKSGILHLLVCEGLGLKCIIFESSAYQPQHGILSIYL